MIYFTDSQKVIYHNSRINSKVQMKPQRQKHHHFRNSIFSNYENSLAGGNIRNKATIWLTRVTFYRAQVIGLLETFSAKLLSYLQNAK